MPDFHEDDVVVEQCIRAARFSFLSFVTGLNITNEEEYEEVLKAIDRQKDHA